MDFFKSIFGNKREPQGGNSGDERPIFGTGVKPSQASIDRLESDDESTKNQLFAIRNALRDPVDMLAITGNPKFGKSQFVYSMLPGFHEDSTGAQYVSVSCTDDMVSPIDFYEELLSSYAVEIPNEITRQKENLAQKISQTVGEIGFQTGFEAKARRVSGADKTYREIDTIRNSITTSLKTETLKFLAGKTLFVDDFHNLESLEARRSIVWALKGPAEKEKTKVILVGVPYDTFSFDQDNQLLDRMKVFNFPEWTNLDLKKIAMQGFDIARVQYSSEQIDSIIGQVRPTPYHVQNISKMIFDEIAEVSEKIVDEKIVSKAFSKYSDGHGLALSAVQKLVNLLPVQYSRQQDSLSDFAGMMTLVHGKELNHFELFLLCSHNNQNSVAGMSIDTIAKRAQRILGKKTQLGQITADFSKIAGRVMEVIADTVKCPPEFTDAFEFNEKSNVFYVKKKNVVKLLKEFPETLGLSKTQTLDIVRKIN